MEPITHLMTGACMSRAGLGQKSRLAALTLVMAAEFPDIDVVAYAKNPVYGFAHHRGITHAILAVPINAALVLLLVYAYFQYLRSRPTSRTQISVTTPQWGRLFMYACMSSAAHIVLDFTNSYGIRPFEPFSHKWYSWDIVFVVEPIIFAVLLIGLLLPSLLSLAYPSENFYIRAVRYRKIAAISALTFIPLLCGLRHIQHQRAVATLRLTLIDGAAPLRVSASPYWLNVFRWQGVLETLDSYQIVEVNSFTRQIASLRTTVLHKAVDTPAVRSAQKSFLGRVYLDWAQLPFIQVEERPGHAKGFTVWFYEMRFYYPQMRTKMLNASVDVAANLEVVGEHFGRSRSEPAMRDEELAHPRQENVREQAPLPQLSQRGP